MDYYFADRDLHVRVDDSWMVRPIAAGVVAHPKEFASWPPQEVPTSVYVAVRNGADLNVVAGDIMRPRAYAGGLVPARVSIHGRQALAFEWTDGILDLESIFVAVRPGRILELTFSMEPEWVTGVARHGALRKWLRRFVDTAFIIER